MPKTISEGNVLSSEGIFFGMQVSAKTVTNDAVTEPGISEAMVRLVTEFQKIDAELAEPDAKLDVLHAPLVFHKLAGKPIQEFGMCWRFPIPPNIINCFNERRMEMPTPNVIDRDAGCQRVLTMNNPVR